jgi:hypothetical protein
MQRYPKNGAKGPTFSKYSQEVELKTGETLKKT